MSRLGLPSEYDYWLAEYSPNIPQKSITTNIFRTLINIFRTSMDIFPGLDISPKLPHLVLSRHRHRCRRCLAEQFHISSLHRQRRGFRVISDNLKKTPTWKCLFFSLRHNFSNFYKPDKFQGVEFLGPIWAPMRLLPNIPTFMFILVVPALYGNIYRFRKKHSTTTPGWYWSVRFPENKLVHFFL